MDVIGARDERETVILSAGVPAEVEGSCQRWIERQSPDNARMRTFYVYILASESRTLYIGVTNDLERRVYEHKTSDASRFTRSYQVNRLVYFEETTDITAAIEREKQLKGWRREKKITLLERANPNWFDLSDRWFDDRPIGETSVLSVSQQDPSTAAGTPPLRMTGSSVNDAIGK